MNGAVQNSFGLGLARPGRIRPRFSAEPNCQNSISHPRVTRIFFIPWSHSIGQSDNSRRTERPNCSGSEPRYGRVSGSPLGERVGGHLPRLVAAAALRSNCYMRGFVPRDLRRAASMPSISLRASVDERKARRFRSSPRRKLISPPSRMAKPER